MNSLNLRGFTFLILFSAFNSESSAAIINGDFATGDFSGWTVSAIDDFASPIDSTPFISIASAGAQKAAEFKTGEFVDGLFIATLEQTFTVDIANPFLTFDFTLPVATPDPTGTGTSSFFDGLFVSLDNGTDFFDLLLLDQFNVLADPFGTAPGATTIGISSAADFDATFSLDMTSLIGDDVTLFIDLINEDDGFQYASPLMSNFAATPLPKTKTVPEPSIIWLFGTGIFILLLITGRYRVRNQQNKQKQNFLNRLLARGPPCLKTLKLFSLLLVLFIPLVPTTAYTQTIARSDLNNADAQTRVHFSSIFHNRRSRKSTTNADIENTSATAVDTPLILVIESISDPNVTVANADGTTAPDGRPYFDFTGQVPGDALDSAESTNTRPLVFNNPLRRRFTVQASVFEQTTAIPTPSVNLELPTDSQGRKLIGAPDGVTLTIRAEGTTPVNVDLGQTPAAGGSRGTVFFGASGNATTATVTTSGGSNNSTTIAVRGDPANPSAFHGDLNVTASVGGLEVASETVTVIRIAVDLQSTTLLNDMPAIRTITITPATAGLDISFQTIRGRMEENSFTPIPEAETFNSVIFTPRNASGFTSDANGFVSYSVQASFGGQGWISGSCSIASIGASTSCEYDSNQQKFCKACCQNSANKEDTQPSASCTSGDYVSLYAGENKLCTVDLSIPGRGFDYQLKRCYRSQASHLRSVSTNDSGVDWAFNYSDDRLIPDGKNVVKYGPTVRTDVFVAAGVPGQFLAPQEHYEQLIINASGNFEIRDQSGMLRTYEGFDDSLIPGRLIRMEDRNGNFMQFLYSTPSGLSKQVLTTVVDTMGRNIVYRYYSESDTNVGRRGRLQEIEDFRRDNSASGRKVRFDYDSEGNLIASTSPVVTGTPNGNDFPDGKTTQYQYTGSSDIPLGVSGMDRERLLHNLTGIQYPNETANDPVPSDSTLDNPRESNAYGDDPSDPASFDRVTTFTVGGINTSGVDAGGEIRYKYEIVALNAVTTNDPFLKTQVIDRRGNVTDYVYSPFDTLLEKREFTRNLRNGEPEAFVSQYRYNIDKELLQTIFPESNIINATFDQNNADRFQQGNLIRSVRIPDARGGDQTALFSETVFEPVYQRPAAVTDSRGLDSAFFPPIADSCGRTQRERYTTRNFFDYQEADAGTILPLLAEELGTDQATVQDRLNTAGIQLGLGDLNGNGIKVSIAGNIVRKVEPNVVLLGGSNQAGIEGDSCQDIVTQYQYNAFGQMTATVDPEKNVHINEYFAETDPDGDGAVSPASVDGRALDNNTGGYLAAQIKDDQHLTDANNGNSQPTTDIRTNFTYDDVGNQTSMLDGRRIRTDFFVNELNQVVQTKRAADVSQIGDATPSEPLPLTAFAYVENISYDFNDNVVKREVEDRGNTSDTGGFVDFTYSYDILDNVIQETQEVDVSETLITQYRYDSNENRTLVVLPEQNCSTAIFDERELQFQNTRGALAPTAETISPPPGLDCNSRDGVPSTITFNYDQNQNLTEQVDADDTDSTAANNSIIAGAGDSSMFLFDGFDRRIATIDAVGNQTDIVYDPVSNIVRQSTFGPVGGESPKNKSGIDNVLLSQMDYLYDELNRKFQGDYLLFVSSGMSTQRPANLIDGPQTPADGKVTMRYEYDRKSRQTFKIEDDLNTYRTDYDGADRVIKETDPEGNMKEYAYDDNDNIIESRETDVAQIAGIAEEFLTSYFYDSLNRLQRQVDNIGQTHYFRYDSRDNQVAMADAEGPLNGAITRRAFPDGPLTVNDINGFGNVTVYQYDGINRKIREDRVLTVSGQGDGSNIGATLEGVKTATPTPDLSQSGDGLISVRYDWDMNSLLTSLTDDNGNQTQYSYDNLNRRLTETKGIVVAPALADRDDPDTTITWEYDPDDNVVKLTDENGSMRNCRYDAINRRIACNIDRAANVIGTTEESYQYDGLSRLTLATDNNEPGQNGDDSLITYAYDSLSRVIEECQNIVALSAKCISSGWLAENRRIGLIYPNDRPLEFTFDDLDRLATITDQGAANAITEYDYIGVSRVLERRYPINGTRLTYLNDTGTADSGYDGLRRTVQLRHLRTDNSLVVGFEHGYDRMNNKQFEKKLHDPGNGDPGNSELYDYDSVYRVVDFQRGTLNAGMDGITAPTLTMDTTTGEGAIQQQQWNLDGLGNWNNNDITTKNGAVTETREHSSFNELIHTADGAPVNLDYDDNGNLTDDGTLLFEWDYRNRLRKVTRKSDGSPISEYVYDAANRRVRKFVVDGAETTDFYYDGWRVLEERDGADALVQQYVYGVYIDEVLVMDRNLDGGDSALGVGDQRLFYHQNALYSVFGLTDAGGVIVEGYLYDAYGGQVVYEPGLNGVVEFGGDDDITVGGVSAVGNPYLYTGRRLDGATELYYYRTRYFDSVHGRFLQRDLIGYMTGLALYQYVGSNPFNWLDSFGLDITKPADWAAGLAGVSFNFSATNHWNKNKVKYRNFLQKRYSLKNPGTCCPGALSKKLISSRKHHQPFRVGSQKVTKAINISQQIGPTSHTFTYTVSGTFHLDFVACYIQNTYRCCYDRPTFTGGRTLGLVFITCKEWGGWCIPAYWLRWSWEGTVWRSGTGSDIDVPNLIITVANLFNPS